MDADHNLPDHRTIAISGLSAEVDMEKVIKAIDQVSPVLMAEYAVKYHNPQMISTEELLTFLRDPEFLFERPSYLRNREVQIHERADDQINVVYLDEDFKPKKTESYTLLQHKEGFPRVYSPSYVPEESINKEEPMVFWSSNSEL